MVKSIGLGFKTPLEAKDGVYIDKKCPWAGAVSIRGKLLRGIVVSNKMKRYLRTAVLDAFTILTF